MTTRKSYPFSLRFKWDLQNNPLTVLLEKKRQQGAVILDLTESNPTAVGLRYPEEIWQALANPAALRYVPHPRGLLKARQAVAKYYQQRGESVEVDRIHLTSSTSEAYTYLFKLLTDPGQNVLAPQPSYPLFEFLAGLEKIELRPYQLRYEREKWRIDFDSINEAINSHTRAIVLVNPNNPTGSFIKKDEFVKLAKIYANHNLALIIDEVFFDYAFDAAAPQSGVAISEVLTFVLSGISKILGLPQMKLGWMVVGGPAAARQPAQQHLDLLADTYLSVSTPIQHAAPDWFALLPILKVQIHQRVQANWNVLQTQLRGNSACRLLNVEGGWYAVLEIPSLHSEEALVLNLLEKDSVLVHPGYFFDFPHEGFLVASLLPAPEIFEEGVNRLITRLLSK